MGLPAHALAQAALEVARERAEQLQRLRAALIAGDEPAALELARLLTGLESVTVSGDRWEPRRGPDA